MNNYFILFHFGLTSLHLVTYVYVWKKRDVLKKKECKGGKDEAIA